MKTLILSTKTGQGHHSASFAVKAGLERAGHEAQVADILKSGRRNVSAPVSSLYDNIILHIPGLFGALYYAGEAISSSRRHSPIYYLNSLYADRLMEAIQKINPQVIVCPHIFSGQAVTRLREKQGLAVPAIGLVTDYTCSPFWEETRLDAYVIPAAGLTDEFAGKGLPRGKLHPLGIPVHPRFKERCQREQARAAFGIKAERVVAIVGGSMGFGDIPRLAQILSGKLPGAQIVAVCGHNKKACMALESVKNVLPLEYIDNIDTLMDACDVLITKPGGLSSTEAMVKRVPLVFARPIPGGEVRNARFLSSIGAAVYAKSTEDAADAAIRLLGDAAAREGMTDAQARFINQNADDDIAKLAIDLAGKTV